MADRQKQDRPSLHPTAPVLGYSRLEREYYAKPRSDSFAVGGTYSVFVAKKSSFRAHSTMIRRLRHSERARNEESCVLRHQSSEHQIADRLFRRLAPVEHPINLGDNRHLDPHSAGALI